MAQGFYVYYKAQTIVLTGSISLGLKGSGSTTVGVLQSDWVQMWSLCPQRITRWNVGANCLFNQVTQTANEKHQSASEWLSPKGKGKPLNKPAHPIRLHQQCGTATLKERLMLLFDGFSGKLFMFSAESLQVGVVGASRNSTLSKFTLRGWNLLRNMKHLSWYFFLPCPCGTPCVQF